LTVLAIKPFTADSPFIIRLTYPTAEDLSQLPIEPEAANLHLVRRAEIYKTGAIFVCSKRRLTLINFQRTFTPGMSLYSQ
jgi:hypothetical protein